MLVIPSAKDITAQLALKVNKTSRDDASFKYKKNHGPLSCFLVAKQGKDDALLPLEFSKSHGALPVLQDPSLLHVPLEHLHCGKHLDLSKYSTTRRGGNLGREGNDTESQAKMQIMDHPVEKKRPV